jgi:hypothetical protein
MLIIGSSLPFKMYLQNKAKFSIVLAEKTVLAILKIYSACNIQKNNSPCNIQKITVLANTTC